MQGTENEERKRKERAEKVHESGKRQKKGRKKKKKKGDWCQRIRKSGRKERLVMKAYRQERMEK